MTQEKVSKLKDRQKEIIHLEDQRETGLKKSFREVQDNDKRLNIYGVRLSEGEIRKNGAEIIFETMDVRVRL